MPDDISSYNFSIIGCGHLGRSLAKALLKIVERARLSVSYSGNPSTLFQLEKEGIADLVTTNAKIAVDCNIVFIAIRPADIISLKGIELNDETLVVSCVAGCEIALLEKMLQHKVVRIMPGSPVTIDEGRAVCAVYPDNELMLHVLKATGFTLYPLPSESLFNIFTACVCLPTAFLQMQIDGVAFSEKDVIGYFSAQFAEFEKMFYWAKALTPFQLALPDKIAYIHRMATPGGITEAIINSLKRRNDFINAFQNGIDWSRQIATQLSNQ